ncbi:carbohydrate ABC transporter permease [Butyrivibrio sp. FCS014]|uniref:carbohydrate ABC transporter permease n=1 Tax=Butyrivibrio sp. FCS014 TaxID=1408304 RepID=UPI0004632465|nr:carbohydrate ABC transporter permease [Butyrivibrio sp. FCS014]
MNNDTTMKPHGVPIGVRRTIAYIVLIFFSFLCLIWFYILLINSTRSHSEMTLGFTVLPSKYLMKNWTSLVTGTIPIARGFINSLIVSACTAVLCSYFSAMTAYAINTYQFKGRAAIATFILAIMMIPGQVTALGFLRLIVRLGMDDSIVPLIIPAIASPVTYFYLKQYMESNLPLSLVEAARIDGSGEFRTFNTIILPLIKPAISVQMIFAFVGSWNNYFTPALILHTDVKKTLPVMIAQLRGADWLRFDMGQIYIMIAASIFPVIVIYLILSKYIVGGMAAGAVKG